MALNTYIHTQICTCVYCRQVYSNKVFSICCTKDLLVLQIKSPTAHANLNTHTNKHKYTYTLFPSSGALSRCQYVDSSGH